MTFLGLFSIQIEWVSLVEMHEEKDLFELCTRPNMNIHSDALVGTAEEGPSKVRPLSSCGVHICRYCGGNLEYSSRTDRGTVWIR